MGWWVFGRNPHIIGEIDRCLKKVTEGVETFDDIWGKVMKDKRAGLLFLSLSLSRPGANCR